jgi:hypothetical protein
MPLPISAGCWCLLQEVGLSACLRSQPLLFYGWSLRFCYWELSSLSTPDSSAVRDWLFAPPPFSRVGSTFHAPQVGVRLQFAVYGFQFFWGGGVVQSTQGLHWLLFPGWGGEWVRMPRVVHNVHLYLLQFQAGSFVGLVFWATVYSG